ncbi:uroporphyrinogen-III synthase [Alkalicoccobacillus porphyridii]|uniref:Uroporphyrinogen-III synthase n=1 Tax=Alkalicoccobacillus porphyridii TaxID=2597270 RepID=A0A554A078_9BACI|nr:uroporphyrinogen-III synthase [Alkalicoccobacillus porphyridii]TSB47092.1 uroporphyrinogen-III synthase [Alkalicoccobacillus porphyridii]
MKGLANCHIALAASRKTDEMQAIIRKQGGTSSVRSLQGTVFLADHDVAADFKKAVTSKPDVFVFTTGIGTETLFRVAEKESFDEELHLALQQSTIAIRGYKTLSVLKKYGYEPDVRDEDGTTAGLINAMQDLDLLNKKVMVQLHGMDAPSLRAFLEEKQAKVEEILPYQHISVHEQDVLILLDELMNHVYEAVCFTTAIQARELFKVAEANHQKEALLNLFDEQVLAVSVGKVTTEELTSQGVKRVIYPEHERMGAMIMELAHHLKETRV